jgi:hypothetical protein
VPFAVPVSKYSAQRRPVFAVRSDHKPITRGKMKCLFWILKADDCPAMKNKHPFIPRLIVPEFMRGGLARRCDALDAKRFRSAQLFELLALRGIGEILKMEAHKESVIAVSSGKRGVSPSCTRRRMAKGPFVVSHRGGPAVFAGRRLAALRHERRWISENIFDVQRQ